MFARLNSLLISFIFFAASQVSWAFEVSDYEKKLIEFKQNVCPVGTSENFDRLFKLYRGDGQYVPLLASGALDRKTIESTLPLYEEKLLWINEQKTKINKLKKDRTFKKSLENLHTHFLILVKSLPGLKKEAGKSKSGSFHGFRKDFTAFINEATFLSSFHYPVNHFELRKEYDIFKRKKDDTNSNKTYLFRKIVEDGAQNKNGTQYDLYQRANIDNLYWQLLKANELNENLIYDLEDFFVSTKKSLSRSVDWHRERFNDWEKRTKKNIDFYKNILSDEKTPMELLSARSKALHDLQRFSLDKMAKTYEFWIKESDELQKSFVLETILFNEVGNADAANDSEKKDVAKVVCNRFQNKKYNILGNEDPLVNYIDDEIVEAAMKPGWLNILFKYGEFSFTHFFIPGNKFLYCSDISWGGKKLRKTILEILKTDTCANLGNFHALRYFSRAAMIGRIDMEHLWTEGYVAQEPAAGAQLNEKKQKQLKNQNLYKITQIKTQDNEIYVLAAHITNQSLDYYLYQPHNKKFYSYRNPHFFRYFGPRSSSKKPVYSE